MKSRHLIPYQRGAKPQRKLLDLSTSKATAADSSVPPKPGQQS